MSDLDAAANQQPETPAAERPVASLLYGETPADPPEEIQQQQETPSEEPSETDTANAVEANTTSTTEGAPAEEGESQEIGAIDAYDFGKDWGEILVPAKVDGESKQVPIAELVRSYQIGEAANKRLEEAKAAKTKAVQEAQTKANELHGQFATAAKLIEQAERLLDQETKGIDWNTLRQDDPAEYSAKKAEISERRQEIEKMKREATAAYQQSVANMTQQQQESLREVIAAEGEKLLEKLPEWRSPDTAKAEKAKIVTYLQTQGFDENDIMGAVDHRLVIMARKAMLYDEGQTKADAATKKIRPKLKTMKPGAAAPDKAASKPKDMAQLFYGSRG